MERFSSYMNRWLYGEEGYYTKAKEIGRGGDFYTAVSASQFFGGSIAKHLLDRIDSGFLDKNLLILEVGAHKGYLLADIIQFIYTLNPKLLKKLRFGVVEPKESIKKMQKEYFKKSFGDEVKLEHFKSFEEVRVESLFVVANELFDAFPCEIVYKDEMLFVDEFHKIRFGEIDEEIKKRCLKYGIERGEVALYYDEFANKLFESAQNIEFITFDYGEKSPKREFSCRVYKNHQVYNFFELQDRLNEFFGVSDITFDVCFEHLTDTFRGVGFEIAEFDYQANALINFGITQLLEILKEKSGKQAYLREVNKVKTLIHPSFMGERFKMLKVIKGGKR